MRCPVCVSEDRTSNLYSDGTYTTLMSTQHYWDDEGVEHFHDPNTHTRNFHCSNGHSLYEQFKQGCIGCERPRQIITELQEKP